MGSGRCGYRGPQAGRGIRSAPHRAYSGSHDGGAALDRAGNDSPPPVSRGKAAEVAPHAPEREIVTVPVQSLKPGESPRSGGESKAHIARLAEVEGPLPPILVDRRTMRVIDGMHRLLAAALKGQETVSVVFFDGSPADAFLQAVRANVTHGLPLSQADRRAAAERIIASHPHLSDRALAESVGLAARTVAAIR